MKRIIATLASVILTVSLFAQAPQKMSYQAVVRNSNSILITSANVGMRISILQNTTPVYVETQTTSTNANGLVSLEIGSGTVVSGTFASIDWANGSYFIKTETDPTGGTNYTIIGTSQLLSVPYALYAKTAESLAGGITESDPFFITSPANSITSGNIADWTTAYGWGNHATAGYLTSFTEIDPIFVASPASAITSGNITDWTTAYGWGNHASVGYLTSYTETDPLFIAKFDVTGSANGDLLKFNGTKYVKFTPNYLTSFSELDPAFTNNFDFTGAATNDLLQFNGLKWVKLTPDFSLTNHTHFNATTSVSGFMNATDKTKLDGIETGAEVNVNADWNATSGDAQILNKPVGTNSGDMQYWNGTAWVNIPAGQAGQFLQFSASNIPTWSNSTPTLTTSAVSSITSTSATCGGNITSEGVAPVSDRGVCWSTSTSPTIANSKTTNGTGSGSYTSSITGLSLGTTYYVRAYATSNIGTTYGNELCFVALAIGDTYQGGKVAYILQAGDPGYSATVPHGLIAAPSDQSNASWGCIYTDIAGAEGTAIGTGNQNTLDITAGCPTAGIAAKECADLVLGGYSDWYLPSKDELNKLYLNKVAIGGFTNNKYWSSSEAGSNYAWVQNMGTGYQGYDGKNADPTYYYVRAVRAF